MTTSSESGAPKNASTAHNAAALVALMASVKRHEHLGVERGRGAQIEHPAAQGEIVADAVEVVAAPKVATRTVPL
ncbi:MAG: hypothetical protein R2705_18210 [Ilumatobacteraceae bacterium]